MLKFLLDTLYQNELLLIDININMEDLPDYMEKLPLLGEDAEAEELILKVLLSCRDQGITEMSIGSLMLLLGVEEEFISADMYDDYVELTPTGLDVAMAVKEKQSQLLH